MIWNKPPEKQLEKYRKGCTVEDMLLNKQNSGNHSSGLQPKEVFTFQDVAHCEPLLSEICSLATTYRAELLVAAENVEKDTVRCEENIEIRNLTDKLFDLQTNNRFRKYHTYKIDNNNNGESMKLSIIDCPRNCQTFFEKNVVVDDE